MKCPVCNKHKHVDIDLHSGSFAEEIITCRVCGSSWAVNHGATTIIKDTQEKSFLGTVKGYDYSFAA